MNELEEKLLGLAIGFVGFLGIAGAIVGYYVYKYLRILGETKIEEAEAKRAEAKAAATLRLAKIGEVAAAAAEEQARATGIRGEDKAMLATSIAQGLLSAPPSSTVDPQRTDLVRTAVQAGVTKLRGSLPNGSTTYALTPELVADIVRTASGRPPPALPPADALKTLPRPPRMPRGPGGGTDP